jgi:hypothetical protein
MLPYFVANILAVSFFFISHHFNFDRIAVRATAILAALPLIAITGFKHIKVGTDTGSYVYYFNKIQTFSDVLIISNKNGEIGFWLLNYLGHLFTDNYFIIFTFSAIIIVTCYFYALSKFKLGALSLITLLLIGPFYFQMNGNRQAIAIAIFSISIFFIIKKQPVKYIISIFIGFLFHKSIIICLPLYFIFKDDIKPRKMAMITIVFIIVLVFFQTFVNLAAGVDDRYSTYGDQKDTHGGVIVSLFNILLFFWFLLCRYTNRQILANRNFDILLALYFLGVLISLLSIILKVDPSGFLRLSLYFIQMNIFLVPITILSFRDDSTRYIITMAAVFLMTIYFYMTTSTFSNLTPYRFNPVIEINNES